ncbi:MAG: hypothetical protein KBF93_18910 [Leptospiraceae bacterium]|nr:hypothetical protein [Leptospiraceae bacterium]
MSQNINFAEDRKNINLDWIHSENIYSHDAKFFSEIDKNESWSFAQNQDLSITGLSFLLMRSLLSHNIHNTKIHVTDISKSTKAKIGKSGFAPYFNEYLVTNPILGITKEQEIPSVFESLFLENNSFFLNEIEKKTLIMTGGGILKEKKTNAHEMIEKLFTTFDLKDKKGHFFLRTKLNSYLYLLNPENKSKTFYIQQKNTFPVDFQFYHIKLYP